MMWVTDQFVASHKARNAVNSSHKQLYMDVETGNSLVLCDFMPSHGSRSTGLFFVSYFWRFVLNDFSNCACGRKKNKSCRDILLDIKRGPSVKLQDVLVFFIFFR